MTQESNQGKSLTVETTARLLNKSKRVVYQWIKSGEIAYFRMPPDATGTFLIPETEIARIKALPIKKLVSEKSGKK